MMGWVRKDRDKVMNRARILDKGVLFAKVHFDRRHDIAIYCFHTLEHFDTHIHTHTDP
jgi:hypothetical protein